AIMAVFLVFPAGKTPAIDSQSHQPFGGANRRVGGQDLATEDQLFLPQLIGSAMSVNIKKPRRRLLSFVRKQQICGHRLKAIEIQLQMLESVSLALFGFDQLRFGW